MAIPFSYNVRSVAARWKAAVVSVLGIAGTVGVFIAMLAMAKGFQATLISSGSTSNAIIRRAGAASEMDSGVSLDQVRVIADASQVARNDGGEPLVSPEMVVIGAFQCPVPGIAVIMIVGAGDFIFYYLCQGGVLILHPAGIKMGQPLGAGIIIKKFGNGFIWRIVFAG